MHYRFHGRFVSASDAARLSNLKGASKYLSTDTPRGPVAGYKSEKDLARSEAAQRGWESRRAREAQEARIEQLRREARTHATQVKREQSATEKIIREIKRQETRGPAEVIPFPSRPAPAPPSFEGPSFERPAPRRYWDEEEEEEEEPSEEYKGEFEGFDYDESAIEDLIDLDIQLLDNEFADLDDEDKYKSAS